MANGPTDGVTITDLLGSMEANGFTGQMVPRAGGVIHCLTCGNDNDAARFALEDLGRTEGVSDPDDEAVVAALICPVCHTRGTIVLKYGPGATAEESAVEQHLAGRQRM